MTGPLGALLGLGVAFGAVAAVMVVLALFSFGEHGRVPAWVGAVFVAMVFPCAVIVGYVAGVTS